MNALSRMAVMLSPGMPSVSSGTRVGPFTALLAASAAATPSSSPLPKRSGCLDAFFAAAQPVKAATTWPTPGIMPITVPIAVERTMVRKHRLRSASVRRSPSRTPAAWRTSAVARCSMASRISASA